MPKFEIMRRLAVAALLLFATGTYRAVAAEGGSLSGVVKNHTGEVLPGAAVSLVSPQGTILASTRSDERGVFRFATVPEGSWVLLAESPGLAPRRLAVKVAAGARLEGIGIPLQPLAFRDEITVTAGIGRADALAQVPQRVNVIGEEEIALRAKAVLAQAATDEVGLQLQRTSPTIGGVFVRGLTGTKVNVYVDGIRYTTSAQRGGINTFFNMVDPADLEEIEVVRGPSSAEYGSDALGGTVQLLTRSPTFSPSGSDLSGLWSTSLGSADSSGGSSLTGRYSAPKFGLVGTLAWRRADTLRPGEGLDSHNAVTRFFDLPSGVVIGEHLPDTDFSQYGGHLKANWAITPTAQLMASYLRGEQKGGERYDQLLGGDGNLVADLKDLAVDHFYTRFEKAQAGFLDRFTVSYSYSSQREERINQGGNGNPNASINHEPERTEVHGLQASAQRLLGRNDLTFGGDLFYETIEAASYGVDPATGARTVRRGRVPDGATYHHGGLFLQDVFEAVPNRLRLNGAVRYSTATYKADASDSPLLSGMPLWPDDHYDTHAFTFRTGALWTITPAFGLAANVSRGFRAPDVTDLGTFGLTGSGFEVSNREVEGLGATVGSTADSAAANTGRPVEVLEPETSLSYELTFLFKTARFKAELTGFQTDVDKNVAKQALILPPGAVGTNLGGETIVSQLPSGVVFVASSSNPVLVRTNFDDARLRGLEATFEARIAASLFLAGNLSYVRAEDRRTGDPPNIEGGTPAPEVWLKLRAAPGGGRRFWVEPYLHAAARQDRLSTLDLADRRTGASRSASSIAGFFNNGARARGLVGPGIDGMPDNSDDALLATGETLSQVQLRVLGPGGSAAPLFTAVDGYAVFGVRAAVRFGTRHEVLFDLENLGDENYRGISWGMDAPGRGIYARYALRF